MADITITEKIQVVLEKDGFRDALYFTKEEREALSDGEVEALAQQRIDNYEAMRDAPRAPEPEKTAEQVEAELEALTQEAARLADAIAEKQVEREALTEKVAEPVRK